MEGSDMPGACDCHTHVFLAPERYPFAPGRRYTPTEASVAELQALLARLGLGRVVIVQPSVYGTDNTATLAGIREIGTDRARGIAGIDASTSDEDLRRLARGGFRGIRANLEMDGEADSDRAAAGLRRLADRIAPLGWHIQIYAPLHLIASLSDTLTTLPVPVVLDHFASARAELGPGQPGFAEVLAMVRTGRVHVKLSGAYRASATPPYADVAPLARALIAAGPSQLVWGSDWPHPDPHGPAGSAAADPRPGLPVDDAGVLGLLDQWTDDPAIKRAILVENPDRLYFS